MNIYYQGSDGSIRSLGDNELAHYNHNHDALGRFARGGGSGITKMNNKIGSLQVKETKYRAKASKYQRKANKVKRLAANPVIGLTDANRGVNYAALRYEGKGLKYTNKADKTNKKIAKLNNKKNKLEIDNALKNDEKSIRESRGPYLDTGALNNRKNVKAKIKSEINKNEQLKKLRSEEKQIWKEFDKHFDVQMYELSKNGKVSKETNRKLDELNKKGAKNIEKQAAIEKQIAKKYVNEYSKATIKDLNLNDSKEAEEYISGKLNDVYWVGEYNPYDVYKKDKWK